MTKTLGWGFGRRAYCNRFKDGVVLILDKEKVFLSPSKPDIFIQYIRSMLADHDAQTELSDRSGQ